LPYRRLTTELLDNGIMVKIGHHGFGGFYPLGQTQKKAVAISPKRFASRLNAVQLPPRNLAKE
jgi:hypothetical protein